MSRLRVRLASIAAAVLLFSYLAIANFVPEETRLATNGQPTRGLAAHVLDGIDEGGAQHAAPGRRGLEATRQEVAKGALPRTGAPEDRAE